MKQLERWWPDIVHDIEHGTISHDVNLPNDISESLVRELQGGDRERARELTREFESGFDRIMKRVWPNLTVLLSIDSAGIWPALQKKYAKGNGQVKKHYISLKK